MQPELTDLDYAVLSVLPLEGTQLGYIPNVKSVKFIMKELNAPLPVGVPRITSSQLSATMRDLNRLGLASQFKRNQRVIGWQVTAAGRELLKSWSPPDFMASSSDKESDNG